MEIKWEEILVNVISTFFAAIIVGAGAIIWTGATTVDDKVDEATLGIEKTVEYLQASTKQFESEFVTIRKNNYEIASMLDKLADKIDALESNQGSINVDPFAETEDWQNALNQFGGDKFMDEIPQAPELPQAPEIKIPMAPESTFERRLSVEQYQMPNEGYIQENLPSLPKF